MVRVASMVRVAVLILLRGALASDCDTDEYYADVDMTLTGSALRAALHARIKSPHDVIPYTSSATDVWDALKEIDADPSNPDNVLGIYSRRSMPDSLSGDSDGWNREHSWPKSCGVGYEGPDFSDLHHLFPADWSVNSARGNKDFGDCINDGTPTCEAPAHAEAPNTADDVDSFLPPPSTRGDIARATFYMVTRYDGGEKDTEALQLVDGCGCAESGRLASYAWLRQWHEDDPVDDAERNRNAQICTDYQGNRNPFVDMPELVAAVFDDEAEAQIRADACNDDPPAADDFDGSGADRVGAGDVLIAGAKFDNPDDVVIVFLKTFPNGVALTITDNGWLASGNWRDNEGTMSLSLPSVAAGQTATLAEMDSVSGSFALSASGDQIFVVDNGEAVAGLHTGGGWSDATDSSTSALPPGLEDASITFEETPDAYCYDGIRSGTTAELHDALTDSSQWTECSALDASPFFVSDAAGGLNGTSTAALTSAAAAGVVGVAAVVALW